MKTMLAELKRLFNRDSIYKNVSAHNQYLYLRFHRKAGEILFSSVSKPAQTTSTLSVKTKIHTRRSTWKTISL